MRIITACLSILLLCLATMGRSYAGPDFEAKTAEDIKILKDAKMFCIGGYGFAARKTPAELALRRLLKSPDAVPALQAVMKEGELAGKVYALAGLKAKSSNFTKFSEPYLHSKAPVSVGRGCTVGDEEISKVVEEIGSGTYDKTLSNQTVKGQSSTK